MKAVVAIFFLVSLVLSALLPRFGLAFPFVFAVVWGRPEAIS